MLTVSDSRTAADDRSGDLLVERLQAAGHHLADRDLVVDDTARDPGPAPGLDRRSGGRRGDHHRRHRGHRPRRHPGSVGGRRREADPRLRRAVPDAELREDRHLGVAVQGHRRGRQEAPTCSPCRARPAPARTAGTASSRPSWTSATGPAILPSYCPACASTRAAEPLAAARSQPVAAEMEAEMSEHAWQPPADHLDQTSLRALLAGEIPGDSPRGLRQRRGVPGLL